MQSVFQYQRYPWVPGVALALAVLLCLPPPDVLAASSRQSVFANRQANHAAIQQRNLRELQAKQGMLGRAESQGTDHPIITTRPSQLLTLAALPDLSAINIPAEDGQILEVWQPTPSHSVAGAEQITDHESRVTTGSPTVIILQDLHTQEDAQLAEGRILQHLHKTYNVKLVAAEGAEGPFQIEFFKRFPEDDALRTLVAHTFLAAGELTGHEYQIITEQLPVDVYGVEDMALHAANTQAYRDMLDAASVAHEVLGKIQTALEALEPKLYSDALHNFLKQVRAFEAGELPLPEFVKGLEQQAREQGVPFEALAPNLVRLQHVQELEATVDREAVEAELQQMLVAVSGAVQQEKDQQTAQELQTLTERFQQQQVSAAYFYPRLVALTNQLGIGHAEYPSVVAFADYITESQTLQSHRIAPEIDVVEWAVTERLAGSEEALRLAQLQRYAKLLHNLFALHLTPDQLVYFHEHREEMASFINESLAMTGLAMAGEAKQSIDTAIPIAERFYDLAQQRDHVLINNTLHIVSSQKPKTKNLMPYCLSPEDFTPPA